MRTGRRFLLLLAAVLMAVVLAIPPVAAQTGPDPGCPPGFESVIVDPGPPLVVECVPDGAVTPLTLQGAVTAEVMTEARRTVTATAAAGTEQGTASS